MKTLEEEIKNYLNTQLMFGGNVTPFEFAMQCIFTTWNSMETYDGKEKDQEIILAECSSLDDITKCLNSRMNDWNFIKSPAWQRVYCR